MTTPLLELEGTVEEIQHRLADFAGQRLHVTVRPAETTIQDAPENLSDKRSISDILLEIAEAIPLEERAKMPSDLAEQHDHYIYGWPKK